MKDFNFRDWPHEGPMSVGHLLRHVERFGGDPKRWLSDWIRMKQIHENDRIAHYLRLLVEALWLGGTYD